MPRAKRGGQRGRFAAFVVVSIATHVAAAAYLITSRLDERGNGVVRDVIEVSLVEEVRVARADVAEAALPVVPLPAEPSPAEPVRVTADKPPPEPERIVEPTGEPGIDQALPPLPRPAEILVDMRPLPEPTPQAEPPLAPAVTVAIAANASASAGEIERYARSVAVAISRARPRGIGRSGRVEIEFTVAESGRALDRALVLRSSGNAKLDTLAQDAVKRAQFPSAPAGTTLAQRTFRVPFNFE